MHSIVHKNTSNKSLLLIVVVFTSFLFGVVISQSSLFGISAAISLIIVILALFNLRALIFLAIAIAPMTNIVVVQTGLFDLRMEVLLWSIILFMLLLRIPLNRAKANKSILKQIGRTKIMKPLMLMLVVYFLSIFVSNYPYVSLRESIQLGFFVVIFVIIFSELSDEEIIAKTINTLLISAAIFIAFGVMQIILGRTFIPAIRIAGLSEITKVPWGFKEQYTIIGGLLFRRADSFFLGPVATATYLILFLPIIMSLTLSKYVSPRKRRWCYILFISGSFLLLMTFSRGGWVTLAATFAMVHFLKKKIGFSTALAIAIFLPLLLFYSPFVFRFMEIFSIEESSFRGHLMLWSKAITLFMQKPLLGHGAGTFPLESMKFTIHGGLLLRQTDVTFAHQGFLDAVAETGILGLLALVWLLSTILKESWSAIKLGKEGLAKDVNIGLFTSIIGLIMMNLTVSAFGFYIYWIFFAIAYSFANISKKNYMADESATNLEPRQNRD